MSVPTFPLVHTEDWKAIKPPIPVESFVVESKREYERVARPSAKFSDDGPVSGVRATAVVRDSNNNKAASTTRTTDSDGEVTFNFSLSPGEYNCNISISSPERQIEESWELDAPPSYTRQELEDWT